MEDGIGVLSRRQALQAAAATLVSAIAPVCAREASTVPFGAAVRPGLLDSEADYSRAIRQYCAMIVPEGGMLWNDIRPNRETFDFSQADQVASFAASFDLRLRGHTLVWYGVMPKWTEALPDRKQAEAVLREHIETVVARYRSKMDSWVVVNEPLADDAATPDDLRPTVWQKQIGADHLALAFQTARSADPSARLLINEYDIEYVGSRFRRKREALTALVRTLVDRKAPIQGVGIQAHLRGDAEIDTKGLVQFARDMRALGLPVAVTELDVIDNVMPADVKARDRLVAERARTLLSALSQDAPLDSILTWGITDKYTWVPMYYKRSDGLKNRPLPLGEQYEPKPLMAAIAEFGVIPGY
jgi:endo-1,4-beta-xylanase